MKKFNLCWVHDVLTTNQNVERSTRSHGLPVVFEGDLSISFQKAIIIGESQFLLYDLTDLIISAQSHDEMPEKVDQKIDREKCRISILVHQ
jgi:hypothetical protein